MYIETYFYLYNSNEEAVMIKQDGFRWVLEYEDGVTMIYRTKDEAVEQAELHGYIF